MADGSRPFITMNDASRHHCCQLKTINVFANFYFDKFTRFIVACSKRSECGDRCEVKKAMKSRGRLEVPSLTSPPPSLLFFAVLFTSHRSPLSERLEQASFIAEA